MYRVCPQQVVENVEMKYITTQYANYRTTKPSAYASNSNKTFTLLKRVKNPRPKL